MIHTFNFNMLSSTCKSDVVWYTCDPKTQKVGAGAWIDSITIIARVLSVHSIGMEIPSTQGVFTPTLYAADKMGHAGKLKNGCWRQETQFKGMFSRNCKQKNIA